MLEVAQELATGRRVRAIANDLGISVDTNFVSLCEQARQSADLQPKVLEVKQRMAALAGEPRPPRAATALTGDRPL
jgi:hypothetical protein